MSTDDDLLEPERYELFAPPLHALPLARRSFFRALGVGGGGLVVALAGSAPAQEAETRRRGGGGADTPKDVGAWLHVAEDGVITVYTGKVEVGQDIRTSLTQAVVDELPSAPESVRLVMGDTGRTPFDRGTFGSRTTPAMAPLLRQAAATARQVLATRAAASWGVPVASVVVEPGRVTHPPTSRSVAFGALTKGQRLVEVIGDQPGPKTPAAWTAAGRSLPKVDARAIVTGARLYTSDLSRPGMLIGKVLRPPRFGAVLEGLDDGSARAMRGAMVVRDGAFAGVVAPDAVTADRALAALRPRWKLPEGKDDKTLDSAGLFAALRTGGRGDEGRGDGDRGDVEAGMALGAHRLSASYEVAYIAHAPLEPRAAVAAWQDGRLTVETGTQRPFGVRAELAQALRIPEQDVRVMVPDTGSGYGGKHSGEAAVEAARLARAAGKPVKLVWTRQEEFTWAYFRPAGVIELRSAVSADGKLAAWDARTYNAGASGLRTPYAVPHQRHRFVAAEAPLRQGSYRALASTANHFAREVHMDELAALVKLDPLAFRERNLGDVRLLAVLRAAAERFGWVRAAGSRGTACGLACGIEKGGYVASCAEVRTAADGGIEVTRVVTAFDCGAVVNPDGLINQIEGAVIMGLGGALYEAIEFAGGRITNPRFGSYRVPRFRDIPKLETVLVDRKDQPSAGAGETPIVAVAPAIANALLAATGKPQRSMPMRRPSSRR